jgi:hypothetical protein
LVYVSASNESVYHQDLQLSHRVMYQARRQKWMETLLLGKSHQPLHVMLDYHAEYTAHQALILSHG